MRSQLSLEFYNSLILMSLALALLIPIFSFLQESIKFESDAQVLEAFASKISTMLYQVNLENGLEVKVLIPEKLGSLDYNLSFIYGKNIGFIVGKNFQYSFPCPPNVNNTTITPGSYIIKKESGVISFYESSSI